MASNLCGMVPVISLMGLNTLDFHDQPRFLTLLSSLSNVCISICFVIGSEYAKTTLDASIFYGPFARSSLDVRLLCFSQLLREDPNSLPGQLWECPSRPSPLPRAPRVDRIALNFVEGSAWGQQDSIRSVNGDFFFPPPSIFQHCKPFSILLALITVTGELEPVAVDFRQEAGNVCQRDRSGRTNKQFTIMENSLLFIVFN